MAWINELQRELSHLPATLASYRKAGESIEKVSADLEVVSQRLAEITEALDAAGLAEATAALKASAEVVRDAQDAWAEGMSKLPGSDLFSSFLRPRK